MDRKPTPGEAREGSGEAQAPKSAISYAPEFRTENTSIFQSLGFGTKLLSFAHTIFHNKYVYAPQIKPGFR